MDENKFNEWYKKILEETNRKIKMNTEKLLEEMKKRFDEVEQKRIQDTFYFEYTYGEKISELEKQISSK